MALSTADPITDLLTGAQLRSVFQPIVDLTSRAPVGYEALIRGPSSSPLERPDALFAAARRAGLVAQLDRRCQEAAIAGAVAAGLKPPSALFVNVEPDSLAVTGGHELDRAGPIAGPRVVVELTERALTRDPAGLLAAVARARAAGFGIALDDIGADPASLALMPFLQPDVLKLDLRLVQKRTSAEIAEIVNAVGAHAERTGAAVVAEGIETEEHLQRALTLGATHGQGWLFGRPGPLPAAAVRDRGVAPLGAVAAPAVAPATPFGGLTDRRLRRVPKRLLLPMSQHLEHQALRAPEPPVLLAALQEARHFTTATAARYADLTQHCSLVAALGVGLGSQPRPGVRGTTLPAYDPLAAEWVVTVVGPHYAGALIARDVGDRVADAERRFDYVITHDRELVLAAARSLLQRITAAPAAR